MINITETQKRCGYNLRAVREEKRMSVEALAVLSGIDEQEIREIEAGTVDPYVSTLFLLAEALNVDHRRMFMDPDCKTNFREHANPAVPQEKCAIFKQIALYGI